MADNSGTEIERDPDEWKTGGEPATEAQKSYLGTLATEAGEDPGDLENLTKTEASKRIDELQEKSGRDGEPSGGSSS